MRELWSVDVGLSLEFISFFELSILLFLYEFPADSSVGRAMDCSSIGHVFNSHPADIGLYYSYKLLC